MQRKQHVRCLLLCLAFANIARTRSFTVLGGCSGWDSSSEQYYRNDYIVDFTSCNQYSRASCPLNGGGIYGHNSDNEFFIGTGLRSCYCNAGYEGNQGPMQNEYKEGCKQCTPGKYKSEKFLNPGASKQEQASDNNYDIACLDCPLGKYSSATGAITATVCEQCPIGKTTNGHGKTSSSDCESFCVGAGNLDGDMFNTAAVTKVNQRTIEHNVSSDVNSKFTFTCPDDTPFFVGLESKYNQPVASDPNSADRSWIVHCGNLNGGKIKRSDNTVWLHSTGRVSTENTQFYIYEYNILKFDKPQNNACPSGHFMTGFRASYKSLYSFDRIYQIQCATIYSDAAGVENTSYSNPMYVHETTLFKTDFAITSSGGYAMTSVNSTHVNADRAFTIGARAACFRCNSGYAKTSCTQCVAGKYTSGNRMQCNDCPANSDSPAGSEGKLSCTCNAGYVSDGNSCRPCEKGKYVFQSSCQNCDPGKYSEQVGATSSLTCKPCTPGSTSPAGSGSPGNCEQCRAGKKAIADNPECKPCPTAYYAPAGSTQCFACPAGTWSSSDELGAENDCEKCEMGKYSTKDAATSETQCTPCEKGKYSNHSGADSVGTCLDCTAAAPGYYCPRGSNNSAGVSCDAGHRCPGGTNDKQECSAGTHAPVGSSTCTVCAPGKYSDKASESCTECQGNHETSPYHATTQSDCFAFKHVLHVCPPGFWRNTTSDQCTPCTVIGHIDDYYHHWRRALRYTHFKLQGDLADFYQEDTVTKYKNLLNEEEDLHHDPDLTMPTDRFNTSRDQLARSCGLTHDAVVCPHGMIADPPPGTGCQLPPLPPANNTPDSCQAGQYHNHTTGTCTACPRNLTTLHPGAWDQAACLFCLPSFYLHIDNATGDEACQPCDGAASCHTTQAFGGAPAHRMTSCSIPCGPEHMHEDNQTTYRCYFSRCMHHVRAQDIHPCALGDDGRMRTNLSASRCHPYFVPVAPQWIGLVHPEEDSSGSIYELYGDDEAVVSHIHAVRHRKPEQAYLDWYYLFFATNVISQQLEKKFGWPHLRRSQERDNENSEAKVFKGAKEVMGMLLAKDATRLREEAIQLHGPMDREEVWPSFNPYEKVLPWTDLVRHVYEQYQKDYLRPWVDAQCNGTETRKNDDFSMYHCHMKFFARPVHPLEWRVEVVVDPNTGTLAELKQYQCTLDNVQVRVQHQLNEHTQKIWEESCVNSTNSECQEALRSISLPLGGLDDKAIEREEFFFDDCNLTRLFENFTAGWNTTKRSELLEVCDAYDGEPCSVEPKPKPWFCYHNCTEEDSSLCLKFKAQENSSRGAVLEALGQKASDYVDDVPYMAGEEALLNDVRGKFCGANQTAREALLQRYSPEFPGGALETFVTRLKETIESYWKSSKYTCRVTFIDGGKAYPCVFDKDHRYDDFFRVSFVNSTTFIDGAYTLNLTRRDDSGVSESVEYRVDSSEYDKHGTRPFCTVASPAEFDMVRAAAEGDLI